MRVAAVDCGTNSIRLLVADAADGALVDVVRRMEVVRLGEGVDATGRIAPASMARTLARAQEYAAQCRDLGAERVRFVATSASRDAENAGEFVAGVEAAFAAHGYAVSPEVVSGAEEAALSFRGAASVLPGLPVTPSTLVVDLGGGSTELVRGGREVAAAISVDMGCVRMTERHLRSDPPTPAEVEAATRDIDALVTVAETAVDLTPVTTLVGVAGTVTTITAHALGLAQYDADRIHGATLSVSETLDACAELLAMTREQRAALGFMHPGRVDVIGAGALIWSRIVTRVSQAHRAAGHPGELAVVTSEHDILDGVALSVAP